LFLLCQSSTGALEQVYIAGIRLNGWMGQQEDTHQLTIVNIATTLLMTTLIVTTLIKDKGGVFLIKSIDYFHAIDIFRNTTLPN
jgi:hypothetical protein